MSDARPLPSADLPARYPINRRLLLGSVAAGGAGLLLTLVGMVVSPRPALLAYLVAYVYWLGLAIGAFTLVLAHHTAGAKWHVSLRRFNETAGAVIPLFLVLFVPLLLGAKHVWFWVAPQEPVSKEMH